MNIFSSLRWLKCLTLLILIGICSFPAHAKEQEARGVLESLKDTYEELPDAGKFATGAIAGFGVTRFTVNKVVTVAKLAGAVFIGCVVHVEMTM